MNVRSGLPIVQRPSLDTEGEPDALRHLWIVSEKAGHDLGDAALRRWVRRHWPALLRARWLEHLQGLRFWSELDRGDFGLLTCRFQEHALLLDRVLDRLKAGQGNLDILRWAIDWGIPTAPLIEVLEALGVNGQRLAHQFGAYEVPVVWLEPAWLRWNDGAVVRLARHIEEVGDCELLPVLGDALGEAGCADPIIVGHCRSGGPYPLWSWLVDQIVERSDPAD
jgi:hypothetical protein